MVVVEAEVVVDLADKEEELVVMEEMVVSEVVAQEAALTEVTLELGLVNQEVADTAAGSVDVPGA